MLTDSYIPGFLETIFWIYLSALSTSTDVWVIVFREWRQTLIPVPGLCHGWPPSQTLTHPFTHTSQGTPWYTSVWSVLLPSPLAETRCCAKIQTPAVGIWTRTVYSHATPRDWTTVKHETHLSHAKPWKLSRPQRKLVFTITTCTHTAADRGGQVSSGCSQVLGGTSTYEKHLLLRLEASDYINCN